MKTTLITILIVLSGTLNVNAQMNEQKKQKSMEQQQTMMSDDQKAMPGMKSGMGQMPMMQHHNLMMRMHGNNMMMQEMPMHRYIMMVKMLPKMQDKLSLSAEQTKELIDMKAAFEKQQVDIKTEMAEKQKQLKELLKNEASPSEVEAQLQECARSRVKLQVAAYETAMNMQDVLNEDQKEKACKMMDNDSTGMMPGMKQGMINQ
ncbi:MAG: periplasmic protein CpxP/Spy [Anaerophaga sp.]|uniref:hypothetical protein n=1 Tax=Anaerophaga thermohalophila TaxID=177400 RepID=UPI000237CA66|nr:hypothetical protein [Anaerophaga thermohalophila]MDI3521113.1 periplasmic protein CpxP/Spy [Anaerophaga sp.]MDK2841139.1 periplasmic protein CpxP/Spy [Anaerophaga sp.]MDN5291756.1 periplasmic protein CpxP/Spy [Anaerophaga sp.]